MNSASSAGHQKRPRYVYTHCLFKNFKGHVTSVYKGFFNPSAMNDTIKSPVLCNCGCNKCLYFRLNCYISA
jgi:hypothetical protein